MNEETLKKKSIRQLIKIATTHFNAYIRQRDKGMGCISCSNGKVEQAGHFYSAGHHAALRFNVDNVHGQCLRCNHFLSGNLGEYRKTLETKIGTERLRKLDDTAAYYKRNGYKWTKEVLIDIIKTYKNKHA